jgi:23S rRNA pseudouridine1911/1915/1917 synthase
MDERYQYIIEEEDTELPLKELLKRRLGFSSRLLRQIKVRGQVYLDSSPVRLNVKGKTGERMRA